MSRNNNICKFFQQGRCNFGDRCKFQHPGSFDGSYDARDHMNSRGGGRQNYRGNDNYSYQGGDRGGGRQTNYSWSNQGRGGYSNQGQRYGGSGDAYHSSNRFSALDNQGRNQQNRGAQSQNIKDMSSNEIIELLSDAMDQWQKGNMWLFTCVSWGGDYDCLPGFEDLSPEELRMKAYDARASNTFDSYKQMVAQLTSEVQSKRARMKDPNAIAKGELTDMIDTLKKRGPTSSSQSSSTFGSTPSSTQYGTTTLFGKPVGGSQQAQSAAGIFGSGKTTDPQASLFGKPAAASQPATLFGKPVDQSSGVFGQPTATATNQSAGIFGSAGATGSSVFGGGSGSTGGSVFGGGGGTSTQTSNTPFGGTSGASGGTFGSQGVFGSTPAFAQSNTSTPFPSTNQNTAAATGSVFGQSQTSTNQNAPFGQPSGGSFTSPGFGGASPIVSQPGTTFGGGNSNTTVAASPISGSQTGVFGDTSIAPQTSTFGTAVAGSTSQTPIAQSTGGAGDTNQNQKGLPMYTPLDKLTAEERTAFQAPKFVLGKIPVCPPPRELC